MFTVHNKQKLLVLFHYLIISFCFQKNFQNDLDISKLVEQYSVFSKL